MALLLTCSLIFMTGMLSATVCDAQMVDCNVTYFISEGYKCQGVMVTNLKNNPQSNCSHEYTGERACMRRHIHNCISSSLPKLVDPVTSLLMFQLFHCGDVKYQPSMINSLILKQIKCNQSAFDGTDQCWRYFRERLIANRSDPLLCREYALAKECRTETAKASCEICKELPRDTYNPFCPDNTDPYLSTQACDELKAALQCSTQFIYKSAMECDKKFVQAFLGKEKPNCGSQREVLLQCLEEKLSSCQDISNSVKLKNQVQSALWAVLRGFSYFCSAVTVRSIDIGLKARPLAPCSDDYFVEMEKCALPFRKDYSSLRNNSRELCRAFSVAVKCSNEAQKSQCNFKEENVEAVQVPYNSISCKGGSSGEDGSTTTKSVAASTSARCFTFYLLMCIVLAAYVTIL